MHLEVPTKAPFRNRIEGTKTMTTCMYNEQAEVERKVKTHVVLGQIKMSRAVATKYRAPDTQLVRMDMQRWPTNGLHFSTS